jgi:hypothetical protein
MAMLLVCFRMTIWKQRFVGVVHSSEARMEPQEGSPRLLLPPAPPSFMGGTSFTVRGVCILQINDVKVESF